MDLATIEIPKTEARERLEEYRRSLETDRNAQDERIAAGYRALARGLPVLKLSESVQRGGWFDYGLPKIAVVRAHETVCSVRLDGGDVIYYGGPDVSWDRNRGALVNGTTVRVHAPLPADIRDARGRKRQWHGKTMVPIIPPRFRPNRNRLHRFHILWEVEEWQLAPPRDPALLRFVGGDLWAVVATWDLTELERAVLGSGS